jgi:hypothetical protein
LLELHEDYMPVGGAARFSDLIYLSVRDKEWERKDVAHAVFLSYDQGKDKDIDNRIVKWNSAGIVIAKKPKERMVAVGWKGQVLVCDQGEDCSEENLGPALKLENVSVIGGYAYACGMKREVFKRIETGKWVSIHAPRPPKGEVLGFNAIDGFSEEEVYAAGWEGEIWRYNSKEWFQIDSPTNMRLHGVCCAGDGFVYICGINGTLIKGRKNEWQIIGDQEFKNDLWDLHWFNDRLYAVTMYGIYELVDNELKPMNTGDEIPSTCYRLTSAEGVMWSIGTRDILRFDGKEWERIL